MPLRILLHKLTDERHALEIVRDDGRSERIECETRSYLEHDLLHYAVEAGAGLDAGFWGSLAGGRTLGEMNDRSRPEPAYAGPDGMVIERVVGALSSVTKGRTPEALVSGLAHYAESLGQPWPTWLTVPFVEAVQERMRRLVGRWRATPFGRTMDLSWPPPRH